MVLKATLLRTVLAAAALIGTGYALPGASSSRPRITSTPASNSASPASTQSSSSPTETIIIAALGEDEEKGDLKSKWQTYWVTGNGEPDWCKPDSSKLITQHNITEGSLPITLFYGDGDPDRMNGCSYDENAYTWGCDGWSTSCRVVTSSVSENGKVVDTCDGLEVLQLITCVKDASSTTATQTIKATATSTGSNTAYTSSCNQVNMNKETWDAEGMRDFVWEMAEMIPSDHDGSFIKYLNSKITGENQFECDLSTTGNSFECTNTGGSCREDDNARYYFIKTSINHFFKWVSAVLSGIEAAETEFAVNQLSVTDTFINTDLPPSDDMWIATLFAGLLGGFSGILGAAAATLPALAKEASSAAKAGENYGLAAGLTGTGSGVATDTNALVSNILETADGVIQNRLNTLSSLEDYISSSLNTTRDALMGWAKAALYNTANNSEGTRYLTTGPNLAKIIVNGDFAEDSLDDGESIALDDSIVKRMYASAIGYLWHIQNVYIVRLSAELPVGKTMVYANEEVNKTVCDVNGGWFGPKQGIVRVCDGDTAYFFIKRATEKEQEIYGADDDLLKRKFALSLVEIANAAEKTQESFGYIQSMNVEGSQETVLDRFRKTPLSMPLFVGMNFCDLDALEDFWRPHEEKWSYLNDISEEIKVIGANSCAQQKVTIDGEDQDWPSSSYFNDPPDWSSKY